MNDPEITSQTTNPESTASRSEVSGRTRTGKVARLPQATRDKLNQMLLDGVPYLSIIESLAQEAPGLLEINISRWRSGGYLDWLRKLEISDALRAKYELARDIVTNSDDDNAASHAVIHSISLNLCEFLATT